MGQAGRRARNFFDLSWILDPGKEDRQQAAQDQRSATDMWLASDRNNPTYGDLYSPERFTRGAESQLSSDALYNNGEYQAGQAAQLQALRQMQGIAGAGGYTDIERGQIEQAQRQAAQAEQSQRQAVTQQMQMRGMGGSGADLAARLQAQQSGANQGRADATNIATQAQMRALQAMQGAGQVGNQVQSSATQRASAVDAFNQANTNRNQQVEQRNAAGRGAAVRDATNFRNQTLAGATGQYNANAGRATDEANRLAAQNQGLVNTVIGLAT